MALPSLLLLLLTTSSGPTPPPPLLRAEPSPPASSAADPAGSPEALTLLARAMDLSLPEKERTEAVAALGRLGESRLVPVLGYLMNDRALPLRRAAVAAAGAMQSTEAQDLLVTCARDTRLQIETRQECVRTLHRQGLPTAPDRLEQLGSDSKLHGMVTALARAELEAHYPSRLQEVPEQTAPVASRTRSGFFSFQISGQQTLTVAGAAVGGYSLYALGDLGRTDNGPAIGLIGGAALGGVAGYLLGKDVSQARALTLTTGTGLGLWTGLGVGLAALSPSAERRYLHFFALGGEALGMFASWAAWDSLRPLLEVSSPQADPWITPTAILLTTPALHLISQINNDDGLLQGLAVTSGIVLGATTGMLLKNRVTDGRGAYLLTGTGWSMGLGALGMLGVNEDPLFHQVELAMLGTGLLGLGLSQLTWEPELKTGDITTLNGFGAGGLAFGGGLIFLYAEEDNNEQAAARLLMATTAAGLVGGRLLTEHLRFSAGDGSLLALGLGQGLVMGALLPSLFPSDSDDSNHRLGGALLGGSLGSLAMVGLTQMTEYTSKEVSHMVAFDAFSALAGLGTALVLKGEDASARDGRRGLLLGSVAGLAAGSQLAPRIELSPGDTALVGLASGWGAWQGLGLAVSREASGEVVGGATLLGLGLGGLAGIGLAQKADVTPGWVAAAGSGALWGGWLMTSAQLAWGELDDSDTLPVLLASDVGLALSTLALSPLVGATPGQVGITSLGGLGGGVLFTLGAGLFTRESRTLLQAGFFGTTIGLVAGGLFAGYASPAKEEAPTATTSTRTGLPSVWFRGLSSAPLFTPDGRGSGVALVANFENG